MTTKQDTNMKKALRAISDGKLHGWDWISVKSGLGRGDLSPALILLENKGIIKQYPGKFYQKA